MADRATRTKANILNDDPTIINPATEEKQDTIITKFDQDYFIELNRGNIAGQIPVLLSGENNEISTTEETIWGTGGRISQPSSAATISFVSDSADDDSAGIGARTVVLNGLDSSKNQQAEIITMDGLTPVVSSLSYLRISSAIVYTTGTNKTNVGNITLTHGATVLATIKAGEGTIRQMVLTVPTGYDAFFINYGYSAGKDDELEAFINIELDGVIYKFVADYMYQNNINKDIRSSLIVPEGADLEFAAIKTGAAGNARISSFATLVLIEK